MRSFLRLDIISNGPYRLFHDRERFVMFVSCPSSAAVVIAREFILLRGTRTVCVGRLIEVCHGYALKVQGCNEVNEKFKGEK